MHITRWHWRRPVKRAISRVGSLRRAPMRWRGGGSQIAALGTVGLALGEAALAHRNGDYTRALDRLLPVRGAIRDIGGSHAQRDLFAQLLIDSAVKSGRREVAIELLNERLSLRPRNSWGLAERN